MDVGAAEGVDGLLGVADDREHVAPALGGLVLGAAEDPEEDLQLHGVRVLELVDEGGLEGLAQAGGEAGADVFVPQCVSQAHQQVAEALDVAAGFALGHLAAHEVYEVQL